MEEPMTATTTILQDDTIYLCDNGAAYCGKHCGASARYTGRDISGQKVEAAPPDLGIPCESCELGRNR